MNPKRKLKSMVWLFVSLQLVCMTLHATTIDNRYFENLKAIKNINGKVQGHVLLGKDMSTYLVSETDGKGNINQFVANQALSIAIPVKTILNLKENRVVNIPKEKKFVKPWISGVDLYLLKVINNKGEQLSIVVDKNGDYVIDPSAGVLDVKNRRLITVPTDISSLKDVKPAFTYGNGSKELYVFIDPECGPCKAFEQQWPKLKEDVKFHVYFLNLNYHKEAKAMTMWILDGINNHKKVKRLMEIANGSEKYKNKKYDAMSEKKYRKLISQHEELASNINLKQVPTILDPQGNQLSINQLALNNTNSRKNNHASTDMDFFEGEYVGACQYATSFGDEKMYTADMYMLKKVDGKMQLLKWAAWCKNGVIDNPMHTGDYGGKPEILELSLQGDKVATSEGTLNWTFSKDGSMLIRKYSDKQRKDIQKQVDNFLKSKSGTDLTQNESDELRQIEQIIKSGFQIIAKKATNQEKIVFQEFHKEYKVFK